VVKLKYHLGYIYQSLEKGTREHFWGHAVSTDLFHWTIYPDMLENLWIKITWDNDSRPSVMVPIGMFFCTYPDIYPYRAYPVGAIPGYFYPNWYMPFSEKATFMFNHRVAQRKILRDTQSVNNQIFTSVCLREKTLCSL